MAQGAQGVAEPRRSRPWTRRSDELARRTSQAAQVSFQAEVDQSGKGRARSGPGGGVVGLCHPSDLLGGRGPDPAHELEDGPSGDLRPQAVERDPRT